MDLPWTCGSVDDLVSPLNCALSRVTEVNTIGGFQEGKSTLGPILPRWRFRDLLDELMSAVRAQTMQYRRWL